MTVTNSYFFNNKSTPAWHSGGVCNLNGGNNAIFKDNIWKNIEGSAIFDLIGVAGGSAYIADNWLIQDQIIWQDNAQKIINGVYPIAVWNDSSNNTTATNWKVYNNTIVNIAGENTFLFAVTGTNNEVKNNLFFCNRGSDTADHNYYVPPSVLHSYNHMYDCSGHNIFGTPGTGESSFYYDAASGLYLSQYKTNPFVDWPNGDFRLKSCSAGMDCPVGAGIDLGSSFNTDIIGTARPQGSAWDIGAYEYGQGGDTTPPGAPTGLSVR